MIASVAAVERRVNGRRRYDTTTRRAAAERNRAAVLDSARHRLLTDGYLETTLASIAADAGVSVDTIYKSFGSKAGVLKALFDVAVAGDDEPVPMRNRPQVPSWQAQTDPRRLLRSYCRYVARRQVADGPIQLLARSAAQDSDAAQVWQAIRAERLAGMTEFAKALQAKGCLRRGITADAARDILWAYVSPETYELLVVGRGWSVDRYGRFLAEAIGAALLLHVS